MKRFFFFGGVLFIFVFWHYRQEKQEQKERAVNAFKEAALERQQDSLERYQEYLKKVKIYRARQQDYQRQWREYQRALEKYQARKAIIQKKLMESRAPASFPKPPEEPILVPSDEHRFERDHELDFPYIEQGVTLEELQLRQMQSERY